MRTHLGYLAAGDVKFESNAGSRIPKDASNVKATTTPNKHLTSLPNYDKLFFISGNDFRLHVIEPLSLPRGDTSELYYRY